MSGKKLLFSLTLILGCFGLIFTKEVSAAPVCPTDPNLFYCPAQDTCVIDNYGDPFTLVGTVTTIGVMNPSSIITISASASICAKVSCLLRSSGTSIQATDSSFTVENLGCSPGGECDDNFTVSATSNDPSCSDSPSQTVNGAGQNGSTIPIEFTFTCQPPPTTPTPTPTLAPTTPTPTPTLPPPTPSPISTLPPTPTPTPPACNVTFPVCLVSTTPPTATTPPSETPQDSTPTPTQTPTSTPTPTPEGPTSTPTPPAQGGPPTPTPTRTPTPAATSTPSPTSIPGQPVVGVSTPTPPAVGFVPYPTTYPGVEQPKSLPEAGDEQLTSVLAIESLILIVLGIIGILVL